MVRIGRAISIVCATIRLRIQSPALPHSLARICISRLSSTSITHLSGGIITCVDRHTRPARSTVSALTAVKYYPNRHAGLVCTVARWRACDTLIIAWFRLGLNRVHVYTDWTVAANNQPGVAYAKVANLLNPIIIKQRTKKLLWCTKKIITTSPPSLDFFF